MKPRLIALGLALLTLGLLAAPAGAAEAKRQAYVAQIKGAISPASAQYAARVIKRAGEAGAEVVVLLLDTPGGLVESMRLMVQDILASQRPVIVYVWPEGARAASAGVMITLAAHVAAMAPGTNIGAASPVAAGGKDIPGTMDRKVTNDLIAYVRSLAHKRGRNADWAEKAVRYAASVPAVEAVAEGVVDVVAPNLEALLDWTDGRRIKLPEGQVTLATKDLELVRFEPSLRDRILGAIANPNLAYMLLMLGLLAVYFELANPGAVLPGVVGAISLILAFFAMQTLSVSVAGLLLIITGAALFLLEIKVTSYGLLSMAGVGCLLVGSIMLFDTPRTGIRLPWSTILPTVAALSAFFMAIIYLVVKAQRRKASRGPGGLMGERGRVINWESQSGKVFIHGEIWRAESEETLAEDDQVEVVGGTGLRLKVRGIGEGR